MRPYFTIINPAAGGGRCGRLAHKTVERLRSQGVEVEVAATRRSGEAAELARQGYSRGFRRFLAAGGDGTTYEVVNGLFPRPEGGERVVLGFLPLGTGNSFLRDFTTNSLEHALDAIVNQRTRPCDVFCLTHREGVLHYINLLSVGFTAEAGELTNRRFKLLGEVGYLLAILLCWIRLHFPVFPLRLDDEPVLDTRPCTYLTFSNSRYTGGQLMIAPFADTADGLIEMTRVNPIGRWDFACTFPKIFTGAHMQHPLISHKAARRVDFQLTSPVDIMIDGEVVRCHPLSIKVLARALDVIV